MTDPYVKVVKDVIVENQERALLHNQYQALLEISEAIAANRDLGALFKELAPKLHRVVQRDRLSLLLEVNNTVVSVLDLHELLNAVSKSLRRLVPHEYASLSLYDAETDRLQIHALDFPVSKGLLQEGLSIPVEGSPTGRARLPAPSRNESADSSWPIEGRCFSMKSATFHWSFNPNSCACSKNRNLNGWAVREPFEWTCGWWPPPT